jgi:hypothetical protein
MATGRMIHRALFTNTELGEMDIQIRFFYVGLVVNADDDGRMKANPKYLKAKIFPFDLGLRAETITNWLHVLHAAKLIFLYAVDGNEYLHHPKWENWQSIRKDRYKPTDCPAPKQLTSIDNQMATIGQPLVDATEPNLTEPNQIKEPQKLSTDKPAAQPSVGFSKQFVLKAKMALDKGFNIYKHAGFFNKDRIDPLPEYVLDKVLDNFLKYGDSANNHWAYFQRVINELSREHHANNQVSTHKAIKDSPVSIGDILKGAMV